MNVSRSEIPSVRAALSRLFSGPPSVALPAERADHVYGREPPFGAFVVPDGPDLHVVEESDRDLVQAPCASAGKR
jgi:hypothetical protein